MAHPRRTALFDRSIVRAAIGDSFRKLDPRLQAKNPVMFVVLVGAVLVSVLLVRDVARGKDVLFNLQIALWLWFTLLFANFAEAMAEGRGKAQAAALRRGRDRDDGAPASPARERRRFPRRACARAIGSSSRPDRSSPATERSLMGSLPSTSRRSRASPPRSSGSRAATDPPSPAARASCRTGSSSRSRRIPARRSSTG